MKKKKTNHVPTDDSVAVFSIVQLDNDQAPPIPTQRVLQIVTKNGETKQYVTESSYFRGELMELFANLITRSYEKSIMKRQTSLKPENGQRYWVHFGEDTVQGDKQERVNPEKFE